MDWFSIATEKLKSFEQEISKEIGLPSVTASNDTGEAQGWDGWNETAVDDDGWNDVSRTTPQSKAASQQQQPQHPRNKPMVVQSNIDKSLAKPNEQHEEGLGWGLNNLTPGVLGDTAVSRPHPPLQASPKNAASGQQDILKNDVSSIAASTKRAQPEHVPEATKSSRPATTAVSEQPMQGRGKTRAAEPTIEQSVYEEDAATQVVSETVPFIQEDKPENRALSAKESHLESSSQETKSIESQSTEHVSLVAIPSYVNESTQAQFQANQPVSEPLANANIGLESSASMALLDASQPDSFNAFEAETRIQDPDGDGWTDFDPGAMVIGLNSVPSSEPMNRADSAAAEQNLMSNFEGSSPPTTAAEYVSETKSLESFQTDGLAVSEDSANGKPLGASRADLEYEEAKGEYLALMAVIEQMNGMMAAKETIISKLNADKENIRKARDMKSAEAELIKEKEKQIAFALKEGEKLSMKMAEVEREIKEYRQGSRQNNERLKTTESLVQPTTDELESLSNECRVLETRLSVAQQERGGLEHRLHEIGSHSRSKAGIISSLDETRTEIDSFRSKQQFNLENIRMQVLSKMDTRLKLMAEEFAQLERMNRKVLADLQTQSKQAKESWTSLEKILRDEIADVEKRCKELTKRNELAVATVPDTTKPLVRQLEALEAAEKERERAMMLAQQTEESRMGKLESQIATLQGKIVSLKDSVLQAQSKVDASEAMLRAETNEFAHIQEALSQVEADIEVCKEKHRIAVLDLQQRIAACRTESADVDMECKAVHSDLVAQLEGKELKEEQLKVALVEAKGRARQANLRSQQRNNSPSPTRTSSGMAVASYGGMPEEESILEEIRNIYESKSNMLASLKSNLIQKESVSQNLSSALMEVTKQRDTLEQSFADVASEKQRLEKRHLALIELCREKQRNILEIEQDIEDIRAMHKEQINQLIAQLEQIRTNGK